MAFENAMSFCTRDAAIRDAVTEVCMNGRAVYLRFFEELKCTFSGWYSLVWRDGKTTSNIVNTRNAACALCTISSYLQICDNCIRSYPRVNRERGGGGQPELNFECMGCWCDENTFRRSWCCTVYFTDEI